MSEDENATDETTPEADGSIAEVMRDVLDDVEKERGSELRVVGLFTLAIYAGPIGEIRIAQSGAQGEIPQACSMRTRAALAKFSDDARADIERRLEEFGVAAGLTRIDHMKGRGQA